MRIALVSPLYESVPPRRYGGTERVVSYLAEQLVRTGHDVTLFASGDSRTSAELVPCAPRALRLDPATPEPIGQHFVMLEKVFRRRRDFDVIHFHIDFLHFPLSRRCEVPCVTTLHGRLDVPDVSPVHAEYSEMPLVSISDAQRRPLPAASWVATVYHGLPADLIRPGDGRGGHLLFLGRISPEKRCDRAIQIARRVGLPLKIAAKVDRADVEYFRTVVEPLLDQPGLEFLGEVGDLEKAELLAGASALLFPIDWPEPFGLVMIEAMAAGTPVVAWRHGSVPEVIDDGITGLVVDDLDAAVEATRDAARLDRRRIRAVFEERFSQSRMANDYVDVYEKLVLDGSALASVA